MNQEPYLYVAIWKASRQNGYLHGFHGLQRGEGNMAWQDGDEGYQLGVKSEIKQES